MKNNNQIIQNTTIKKSIITCLLIFSLQTSAEYKINRFLISTSGSITHADEYSMQSSFGQTISQISNSNDGYQLNGGFWLPNHSLNNTDIIFSNNFE